MIKTRLPAEEAGPGRRWMRGIAVSLAVTAVLIAATTWAAVWQSSRAQDADRQAALTALAIAGRESAAAITGYSEASNARGYASSTAQATAFTALAQDAASRGLGVVGEVLLDEAEVVRAAAQKSATVGFDNRYLDGETFRVLDRRHTLIANEEQFSSWAGDPRDIASAADALHTSSNRLAGVAVGLTAIVLLLTIARVVAPARRRVLVFTAWAAWAGFGMVAVFSFIGA